MRRQVALKLAFAFFGEFFSFSDPVFSALVDGFNLRAYPESAAAFSWSDSLACGNLTAAGLLTELYPDRRIYAWQQLAGRLSFSSSDDVENEVLKRFQACFARYLQAKQARARLFVKVVTGSEFLPLTGNIQAS